MRKSLVLILAFFIILASFSNSHSIIRAEKPKENTDLEEPVEKAEDENKDDEDSLGIYGKSAIVIDGNTGQLVFGKKENEKMYPGSLTQIMTGILVIENSNLDSTVKITQDIVDSTKEDDFKLALSEEYTIDELLKIMMIGSYENIANILAKEVAEGSVDEFVSMMNKKAQELNAINTNFKNPSGLYDDDHYTTASDIALISQYAMKNDYFREIASQYVYEVQPTSENNEIRFLKSENKLLYSELPLEINGKYTTVKYPNTTGLKAGYLKESGSSLVASVEDNDSYLIGVIFSSDWKNLYSDAHKLFDDIGSNYKTKISAKANEFIKNFPVKKGKPPFVTAVLKNDFSLHLDKDFTSNIVTDIITDEGLKAPIKKGEKVGELVYKEGEKVIASSDLIAGEEVEFDPASKWYRRILSKWYLFVFAFMIFNRVYKIQRLRKRRRR